jgi:hypothetical protein
MHPSVGAKSDRATCRKIAEPVLRQVLAAGLDALEVRV